MSSIFWSVKKGTRTFNFRSNEPSHDNLGPLGRYDHPWEKKTKTKKQTRICDLSSCEKCKIPHFYR